MTVYLERTVHEIVEIEADYTVLLASCEFPVFEFFKPQFTVSIKPLISIVNVTCNNNLPFLHRKEYRKNHFSLSECCKYDAYKNDTLRATDQVRSFFLR